MSLLLYVQSLIPKPVRCVGSFVASYQGAPDSTFRKNMVTCLFKSGENNTLYLTVYILHLYHQLCSLWVNMQRFELISSTVNIGSVSGPSLYYHAVSRTVWKFVADACDKQIVQHLSMFCYPQISSTGRHKPMKTFAKPAVNYVCMLLYKLNKFPHRESGEFITYRITLLKALSEWAKTRVTSNVYMLAQIRGLG